MSPSCSIEFRYSPDVHVWRRAELTGRSLLADLDAAGSAAELLTAVRIYVVNADPERFLAVGAALAANFGAVQPCVTSIGVQALAALELQVEIEATALRA